MIRNEDIADDDFLVTKCEDRRNDDAVLSSPDLPPSEGVWNLLSGENPVKIQAQRLARLCRFFSFAEEQAAKFRRKILFFNPGSQRCAVLTTR